MGKDVVLGNKLFPEQAFFPEHFVCILPLGERGGKGKGEKRGRCCHLERNQKKKKKYSGAHSRVATLIQPSFQKDWVIYDRLRGTRNRL